MGRRSIVALCATGVSAQTGLFENLKSVLGSGSPTLNPTPLKDEPVVPVAAAEAGATTLEDMDLLCLNNPRAQAWFNIQQKMRYILGPDAAFNGLDKAQTLEPALYSVMEDMSQSIGEDVCGIGKVMVQLLSVNTMDDKGELIKQSILENEQLTSPMLTLLLDIPWGAYQPMWPMFGFYAQMAMRRVLAGVNSEATDGLIDPELQKYASMTNMAIINGDLASLKGLSQAFLDAGADAVQQSPIGFATAIFTQAALAETQEEAQALFFEAQKVLKKMIFTPADLDTTLATRWPLWGMAYLASLKVVA